MQSFIIDSGSTPGQKVNKGVNQSKTCANAPIIGSHVRPFERTMRQIDLSCLLQRGNEATQWYGPPHPPVFKIENSRDHDSESGINCVMCPKVLNMNCDPIQQLLTLPKQQHQTKRANKTGINNIFHKDWFYLQSICGQCNFSRQSDSVYQRDKASPILHYVDHEKP